MDWCVDGSVPGAWEAVEQELQDGLSRRLATDEPLEEALQRARLAWQRLGASAAYRVSLEWDDSQALLVLRRITPGDDGLPGLELAPGATACPWHSAELVAAQAGDDEVRVELAVRRPSEESLDPQPGEMTVPASREGFLTTMAGLATGLRSYRPEARCAFVGAAAARQAEAEYRRRHAVAGALTTRQVAEAFAEYQQAIGGDFFVVEATDERAVVANRACPFRDAPKEAPHLCRVTSAMLGSLGARSLGDVSVSLDERMAVGDRRCRLELRAGEAAQWESGHSYTWPPSGVAEVALDGDGDPLSSGHGISISLQLPRDRISVPVIRHLARYALGEVGVTREVTFDIELALSEACTNVLSHSGPGDAYEVAISIRAERCELRITDKGRGFDHVTIREHRAGHDAERGRGMALMQSVMDQVDFISEPERGTLVLLTKQLAFDEESPARVLLAKQRRSRELPDQ